MTGYQNSSLDTLRQEFHVYLDDRILTIDLFNFEKRTAPLIYEEGLSPANHYLTLSPVWMSNNIYFVSGSGGLVYSIQNDTVKRIDNSFDHGMQYGAPIFEHEGTLFKYGGYGFWSNRDFFTYFDMNQNEWEVYHPIESKVVPQGIGYPYVIKDKNLFHVFGGSTVNPNNRREQLSNNEVWAFDFKTTTWNFLGKHKEIEKNLKSIPYRNKLVLVNKNHITVIDIKRNTKTVYRHSPISAQSTGIHYIRHASGRFYMLLANSTGAYLYIINEADFFGETIEETKFYKNQAYWLKQGGIFFLVMLFITLIFWLIKKNFVSRNKIKLLDNGLRYHLKFTEFDQESMAIIRVLLNEKEVSSSKILQIVEKPQYSPAHNERIKVQKIKDINIKISALLRSNEDMITSFKSSQDRRIRLYKIHRENFDVKGMTKHRKT